MRFYFNNCLTGALETIDDVRQELLKGVTITRDRLKFAASFLSSSYDFVPRRPKTTNNEGEIPEIPVSLPGVRDLFY